MVVYSHIIGFIHTGCVLVSFFAFFHSLLQNKKNIQFNFVALILEVFECGLVWFPLSLCTPFTNIPMHTIFTCVLPMCCIFTRFVSVMSPDTTVDTLSAHKEGWLRPERSHRGSRSPSWDVFSLGHHWEDLQGLPRQNGWKNQNLEEALVRLWPQSQDAGILCW